MNALGPRTYWWPLGVSTLAAVQHLDQMTWTAVRGLQISEPSEPLAVQCAALLFKGPALIEIGVTVRDIAPGWEVFGLSADIRKQSSSPHRRVRSHEGELSSLSEAFAGRNHHIIVVATQHVVPDWALDVVERVVIEDTLIVRDRSGQTAVISPDLALPGTLRISRGQPSREDESRVAYRRVI
jgi:hypothetical protein